MIDLDGGSTVRHIYFNLIFYFNNNNNSISHSSKLKQTQRRKRLKKLKYNKLILQKRAIHDKMRELNKDQSLDEMSFYEKWNECTNELKIIEKNLKRLRNCLFC